MYTRTLLLLLAVLAGRLAYAQPSLMRSSPPLPSWSGDASLHGVFFLDEQHGWACGDRGTVLVTIDGGAKWDVVSTGFEGSLRFIHFRNPQEGIAIGGASFGAPRQSRILLIETTDGGRTWRRVSSHLPAIHAVGWIDEQTLWAAGDRNDLYPSGSFRSQDGGATWTATPGATPGPWRCGAFYSPYEGVLAGEESLAAVVHAKGLTPLELGLPRPRALRTAALLEHGQILAAGDGGLLMRFRRGKAPQRLTSPGSQSDAGIDFAASAALGTHIWLAGSPGSVIFHSSDAGETWEAASTSVATPIRALHFLNAERGFAVGDLGTILSTRDGGRTWRVLRRGGQHAAYLAIFAEGEDVPWELIARMSGQEGHFGQIITIAHHSPTAGPEYVDSDAMLHRAATRLGATGGEILPGYWLSEGDADSPEKLERAWRGETATARERLEADFVRQIRMWRPEVIFTDLPPSSGTDVIRQMTSQALLSAVATAARNSSGGGDSQLPPWQVKRVYAVQAGRRGFKTVESGQLATRLGRSLQEAAWPARRECEARTTLAPELFGLQLLIDHTEMDPARSDLFSGIRIEAGGPRRRVLTDPSGAGIESTANRAKRHHDVVKLLREAETILTPQEIETQRVYKALGGLEADFSAQALFEIGAIAAARGARSEAMTAWRDLAKSIPDHPLSRQAKSRLFELANSAELLWKEKETPTPRFLAERGVAKERPSTLSQPDAMASLEGNSETAQVSGSAVDAASLEITELLAPHSRAEAANQFLAAALLRQSTDPMQAYEFYSRFAKNQPNEWLATCAEAELWLLRKQGKAPKQTHTLRFTEQRPYLDGKLDEPLWGSEPLLLTTERSQQSEGAECWIAYDREFLYFAARCPLNRVPNVKQSSHSKEGPARDRPEIEEDCIELLLDIDRDWHSFFRLAVAPDGSILDACAGDLTWDPKWYAAVGSEEGAWTVECAIPLSALTPYPPEKGDAWAMGVQRRATGKELQSWTHPASRTIQPAGFGLLLCE